MCTCVCVCPPNPTTIVSCFLFSFQKKNTKRKKTPPPNLGVKKPEVPLTKQTTAVYIISVCMSISVYEGMFIHQHVYLSIFPIYCSELFRFSTCHDSKLQLQLQNLQQQQQPQISQTQQTTVNSNTAPVGSLIKQYFCRKNYMNDTSFTQ